MTPNAVIDASIGVKWLRRETGSAEARKLLERHVNGELELVADHLFLYEFLSVAQTARCAISPEQAYQTLLDTHIELVAPEPVVVHSAIAQARTLGCSLYDAFAPGLAVLLGATLYSADAKAHGAFPDVVLVGER